MYRKPHDDEQGDDEVGVDFDAFPPSEECEEAGGERDVMEESDECGEAVFPCVDFFGYFSECPGDVE